MTWVEVLRTYWPLWLALAGLLGSALELRVRKMFAAWDKDRDAALEKAKADLRTELQKPISGVGETALEALKKAEGHDPRLVELETKTAVFWKMIERSTAGLLRHKGDDES